MTEKAATPDEVFWQKVRDGYSYGAAAAARDLAEAAQLDARAAGVRLSDGEDTSRG